MTAGLILGNPKKKNWSKRHREKSHVQTEAEPEVIQIHAREHQELLEATRS